MADGGTIRSVRAQSDQVHVPQLVCIALFGLSLGLGLVGGAARLSSPTETSSSPLQSRGAMPEQAPNTAHSQTERTVTVASEGAKLKATPIIAHVEPGPAGRAVHEAIDVASQSATPARAARAVANLDSPPPPRATVDATMQQPAASVSSSRQKRLAQRRFEYGLVVYLRCDGLERQKKRFPCPRDRKLEAHVWEALRVLPQCRGADPGFGEAELRLTLHRKAMPRVDIGPPGDGRSLNLRAVSQCTGPGLARLRSRLRSPHAIVTFRFGLS
jgi:hypothetical protein